MAVTYSDNAATTRTNLGLGDLATLNEVDASTIADDSVGAAELNVSGNGTSGQFLSSDGDGSFSWATPSGGITPTTGSAPYYGARAWVNFNGSTATIREDGNVSSVSRTGTGDYTVNFTTAMDDANYSVVHSVNRQGDEYFPFLGTLSTSSVQVSVYAENGNRINTTTNCVIVFR